MIAFVLATLMSCQSADPCALMCSSATQTYGGCLDLWGAEWTDAGYEDAHDFFHSCETWAWSSRQLEADAGERGWTDDTCDQWTNALSEDDFSCTQWNDLDWNGLPW